MSATIDSEKFLKKWYWCGLDSLAKQYALKKISSPEFQECLKGFGNAGNGITLACGCGPETLESKPIVIGGPCISDCFKGFTIESIAEISSQIKLAKTLRTDAVIFLGLEEEQKRSGESWLECGSRFERAIKRLSKAIGHKKVLVVKTDSQKAKSAGKRLICAIEENTSNEELAALYCLGKTRDVSNPLNWYYPAGKFDYSIHKGFLLTYLPQFVRKVSGFGKRPLLAAENIQQAKAIKKAFELSRLMGEEEFGPFHLAHLPFPSLTGGNRMYRSTEECKLFISDKRSKIQALCNRMDNDVFAYASGIWPEELAKICTRRELADFVLELNDITGA